MFRSHFKCINYHLSFFFFFLVFVGVGRTTGKNTYLDQQSCVMGVFRWCVWLSAYHTAPTLGDFSLQFSAPDILCAHFGSARVQQVQNPSQLCEADTGTHPARLPRTKKRSCISSQSLTSWVKALACFKCQLTSSVHCSLYGLFKPKGFDNMFTEPKKQVLVVGTLYQLRQPKDKGHGKMSSPCCVNRWPPAPLSVISEWNVTFFEAASQEVSR